MKNVMLKMQLEYENLLEEALSSQSKKEDIESALKALNKKLELIGVSVEEALREAETRRLGSKVINKLIDNKNYYRSMNNEFKSTELIIRMSLVKRHNIYE